MLSNEGEAVFEERPIDEVPTILVEIKQNPAVIETDTDVEISVVQLDYYERLKANEIDILELPVSKVEIITKLKG